MFEPCNVATLVLFGLPVSSFEISAAWRLMVFDTDSVHAWTAYESSANKVGHPCLGSRIMATCLLGRFLNLLVNEAAAPKTGLIFL